MSKEKYSFDNDISHVQREQSDLSKTTEILLNDLWPRRKTVLKQKIVSALSTLETIAYIYDVDFLKQWIEAYCEYLTSMDGQGRKDIVDITKFSIEQRNARDQRMFDLMGGKK